MALTEAQLAALIEAEGTTRAQIRDQVTEYATELWRNLGDWRDPDVERFVQQVTPRVRAGQQLTAKVTDTYLAAVTGEPPAGTIDVTALRGGVPAEQVYARPAVTMRTELAAGKTFGQAQQAAVNRLAQLVAGDMQLANTRQAHKALNPTRQRSRRGGRSSFYRRTLIGPKNCALCMIASTQRYNVRDLMPIHPGCNCGVAPLSAAEAAAGQVIDPDFLEQIHAEVEKFAGVSARDGRAVDYRKLVAVRQHGEYGPVMGWERHGFTGADDLAGKVAVDAAGEVAEDAAGQVTENLAQILFDDDLAAWSEDDLLDTLEYAADQRDDAARRILELELQRRRAEEAARTSTPKFTRAQLRELYEAHIEDQYRRAERDCYYLVNKAGQASGVSARSLFSGNLDRAWKYSTEELKRWWQQPGNTRLTFAAFSGDADALYLAQKSGKL